MMLRKLADKKGYLCDMTGITCMYMRVGHPLDILL